MVTVDACGYPGACARPSTPTPREVTRELVIALTGTAWDASPKNIRILEGEEQ